MFFKTVTCRASVEFTFNVTDENCESIYGCSLDALDDSAVRAVDDEEAISIHLMEGDWEFTSHSFNVSELQKNAE